MLSVAEAAVTLVQTSGVRLLDPMGIAVGTRSCPRHAAGALHPSPARSTHWVVLPAFLSTSAFCEHRSSTLTQGWALTQEAHGVFGPGSC